ncbi:MAG: hypothetical protein HYZ93_02865 [Candidatus Omnitrophica bacterium]|nr:hypothetical protein [Candidatus Omnitrophota bacterium]
MNLRTLGSVAQVITAVSIQDTWIKLIQAQSAGEGPRRLLAIKSRRVSDLSEEAIAGALKEMVRSLPVPPKEVLGLLSTGEVLTRYLNLPSEDPDELRAMALYQLEGTLPISLQTCVTGVKILGPVGEATRVLVAVAYRPVVERFIRICRLAGLTLTGVATSTEAIGQWHRSCWPQGVETAPRIWLVAELSPYGLDIGVLVEGSLIYVRQVLHAGIGSALEELTAQLKETIQAYTREKVGPTIEQVTLSGWLQGFGPAPLERLEAGLGIPVHWVDPLEASPFRESLSATAQELSPEASFSELLGAACAPNLLGLDLLPLETRWQQAQEALFRKIRVAALLAVFGLAAVLGWAGVRIGGSWWQLRQTRSQTDLSSPSAARVRGMVDAVRRVALAREAYALQMELLGSSTGRLLSGMTLQFLGLEGNAGLTLRGTAPDLAAVTGYAAALRGEPIWKNVTLRSAKSGRGPGPAAVEFEMVLEPQEAKERK